MGFMLVGPVSILTYGAGKMVFTAWAEYQEKIRRAREEGREEGRKEGREEALRELGCRTQQHNQRRRDLPVVTGEAADGRLDQDLR